MVFTPLLDYFIQAILDTINRERNGEMIDEELLKDVVEVFLFLSQGDVMLQDNINSKRHLHERIIEQTRNFYHLECQKLLEKSSLSDYMRLAEKYYFAEVSRGERYLWEELQKEMVGVFREEMLVKH